MMSLPLSGRCVHSYDIHLGGDGMLRISRIRLVVVFYVVDDD
jgi:hypothetical protein